MTNAASDADAAPMRTWEDLVFATVEGLDLQLNLYLPMDTPRPPLVMSIHGGGWRKGTHRSGPTWLIPHGFAVASIAYRLSQQAIFPAQLHDCQAALRWLRARADQFGYDVTRVALFGGSAGGYLATLLGASAHVDALRGQVGGDFAQPLHVDAVVDFYGPTDFLLRARTQPQNANTPGSSTHGLLGGTVAEKPELARLASVTTHVTPAAPPLLVLHGDADQTVFLNQSQELVARYHAAGVEATLIVVPGGRHGSPHYAQPQYRQAVVAFLARHLQTAPPA